MGPGKSFIAAFLLIVFLDSVPGSATKLSPSHQLARNFEETLPQIDTLTTKRGKVHLVNLNPHINRWFLLEFSGPSRYRLHLDNRYRGNRIELGPTGLVLSKISSPNQRITCHLWKSEKEHILFNDFRSYPNPFYPLCNGLVYLRLKRSSKTKLSLTEWSTEMLRNTPFGEDVINSLKPLIVQLDAEAATHQAVVEPSIKQ